MEISVDFEPIPVDENLDYMDYRSYYSKELERMVNELFTEHDILAIVGDRFWLRLRGNEDDVFPSIVTERIFDFYGPDDKGVHFIFERDNEKSK